MITISECPLCGSKKIEEFYRGIDEYYSGKPVRCAVCQNCSLIFLNPKLTEEEYKNWYESVFQDKRRNIATFEEAVARTKGKYNKKLKQLKYFENFVNKNSQCLEIGCGWGTLAKVVKDKFNCEVDVIEPSKLAAKVAAEHFGLNAFQGNFNSFVEQGHNNKKYDFIYSYHVFEHIAEPDIFLGKVKKILAPGGKLLLALPDTLNPEQPSERLFHIDHCFYYTPKTIELMLKKNGFKVLKLWKCLVDMKVVCEIGEPDKEIAFENKEEQKKVKRAISKSDRKYKILKAIRKIIYSPLNERNRERGNRIVTNLLRKIRQARK
jgi:2-polyprenyl-3-methyl-5-hydroxy-6-metoxy-1,4-benzoquinol methylase